MQKLIDVLPLALCFALCVVFTWQVWQLKKSALNYFYLGVCGLGSALMGHYLFLALFR